MLIDYEYGWTLLGYRCEENMGPFEYPEFHTLFYKEQFNRKFVSVTIIRK